MRLLVILAIGVCGCAGFPRTGTELPALGERDPNWPADWTSVVGKSVTLEGVPENWKLGAYLTSVGNGGIWIDDYSTWPAECFRDAKGKKVRVTGTVVHKKDLPVFVPRAGEPVPQGIPAREYVEAKEKQSRYLLKNVKWQVVE